MFAILLLCLARSANAEDIPEEEEEIDLPDAQGGGASGATFDLGESKFEVKDDGDDAGMVDYAAEALKRPADPTHFHLDPTGKQPLGNDYPMQVVAIGPSWVKLELPVLVATSRAAFAAEHPFGLRVVARWEVSGGETLVSEQIVRAESLRAGAPTFLFFDVAFQDARKSAPVRIVVQTASLPDPAAKVPEPPALRDRFAVTSVFYRKG